MFTNIKIKSILWIMLTIFVMLIIVITSIFSVSSSMVRDDYSKKLVRFLRQENQNCSDRLGIMASNMNYISDELNITPDLLNSTTNADIYRIVQKNIKYSPYIKDFYIYEGNNLRYYFQYKNEKPNVNLTGSKITELPGDSWYYLPTLGNNHLYYIKKLPDNLWEFYWVDEAHLFDAFGDPASFFERKNLFFYFNDKLCAFSKDKPSDKTVKNAADGKYDTITFKSNEIIYSQKITGTTLSVCSIVNNSYIEAHIRALTKTFLIILIITMCVCFWMINKFANEITAALNDIHDKMLNYYS